MSAPAMDNLPRIRIKCRRNPAFITFPALSKIIGTVVAITLRGCRSLKNPRRRRLDMNTRLLTTKVFAFFSLLPALLFANFISANAQTDSSINQLPTGTRICVRMDNEINSQAASENDTFTVKISEPLKVRESVVLPIGTVIEGRVTKVRRASAGGRSGSLQVSFETLRFEDGETRRIEGVLINKPKIESSQTANVLTIIGGAAIGGIIGAFSKADNGALIGAAVGAGAGTSIAFLRKGKEVRIATDEEFEIKLTKNVDLPVRDY